MSPDYNLPTSEQMFHVSLINSLLSLDLNLSGQYGSARQYPPTGLERAVSVRRATNREGIRCSKWDLTEPIVYRRTVLVRSMYKADAVVIFPSNI